MNEYTLIEAMFQFFLNLFFGWAYRKEKTKVEEIKDEDIVV